MTTRAAIYCRISSDPKGLRAGVERQERDCREHCERLGWEVAAVEVDNDVSAYSGKPRPGYRRVLEALESGVVNAVVAWHPDRLHRSPAELETFITVVERAGAAVSTVTAGDYDLSTPEGRLSARIVGAVARSESESKSRRIRRKHLELAERGQSSGGPARFGQDDPAERAELAAAAERVLDGASLRSITADWTARGVGGRRWSTVTTRRVLTAPRVAGLREHHGRLYPAVWPAALDRETWEAVRAVLSDPRRTTHGGRPARRYLLAGMIYCGRCGGRLHSRPTAEGTRKYVCISGPNFNGCGRLGVVAEPLEELVAEAALIRLDTPELQAALDEPAPMPSTGELTRAEERLARLEEAHYVTGELSASTFRSLRAKLEREIDRLRAEAAPAPRLPAPAPGLRQAWADGDFDVRRAILSAVVRRVVIGPVAVRGRNTFDPSRVEVEWVA